MWCKAENNVSKEMEGSVSAREVWGKREGEKQMLNDGVVERGACLHSSAHRGKRNGERERKKNSFQGLKAWCG
jgi:hypothetical protein